MKKYQVWATCTSYCYVEVEAETEQEAIAIANDMDGGEFIDSSYGDWTVDEAIEIKK